MKHYRSFNDEMQELFGEKVYKLAFDGGFTCPTRDGTKGERGCIFCAGGSGDFSVRVHGKSDSAEAIEKAKERVKAKGARRYIAYFQSYTGTYAPAGKLRELYCPMLEYEEIAGLSIGTRPDCIDAEVLEVLSELNRIKPVWVELGLQTIHPESAKYIRRGYELKTYDAAVRALKTAGIRVVTHMIIGLPGENAEMMESSARYIGRSGADGVKFQLLHVLEGTDLAEDYRAGKFPVMSLNEYISVLERCVETIPPEMTIHRLTGDGAKLRLVAPGWSGDKKRVLNTINAAFERDCVQQGRTYTKGDM